MNTPNQLTIRLGVLILSASLISWSAQAHGPFPTVRVKELPDGLRNNWQNLKSEMNENSHCAAAFDSARRAMRYCEDARAEHHIKMPCRLIQD